jgi:hypothetical protein
VSQAPEPSPNPTDTPLSVVTTDLAEQGYGGQFAVRENGRVECLTCHETAEANRHHADEVTRLEGVSDPDDMVMVAPLRCFSCGTKGTLVLGYGPEASAEDSDVILALDRTPTEPTTDSSIEGATPGVD